MHDKGWIWSLSVNKDVWWYIKCITKDEFDLSLLIKMFNGILKDMKKKEISLQLQGTINVKIFWSLISAQYLLILFRVLIIDKRDHIGGNCYDYIDEHGIRTSKYGVHIFHTKYDRVKEYVQQFSDWIPYEHRVVAKVKLFKNNANKNLG